MLAQANKQVQVARVGATTSEQDKQYAQQPWNQPGMCTCTPPNR